MKMTLAGLLATLTAATSFGVSQPAIKGDYLEVRSCDIYTGPCFANAEMGTAGKEAMLVWSVKEGSWQGTSLDGLSVIAVVRTDATLGNVKYEPRSGKAVIIVDEKNRCIHISVPNPARTPFCSESWSAGGDNFRDS